MGILTELSDECIDAAMERLRECSTAFESVYKNDPHSYDITTALINRIEALEKRMLQLEKPV